MSSVQFAYLSESCSFGAGSTLFLLGLLAEAILSSSPVMARYEAKGAHSYMQGSGTVPLSCNLHTHSVRFNGKLYPCCIWDLQLINIRFIFWKIIEIHVKYCMLVSQFQKHLLHGDRFFLSLSKSLFLFFFFQFEKSPNCFQPPVKHWGIPLIEKREHGPQGA